MTAGPIDSVNLTHCSVVFDSSQFKHKLTGKRIQKHLENHQHSQPDEVLYSLVVAIPEALVPYVYTENDYARKLGHKAEDVGDLVIELRSTIRKRN